MIEKRMVDLLKMKMKLTNHIIEELPPEIQESINKHKKEFFLSMMELMKEELELNNHSQKKESDHKVKPISID